MDQVFGGLTSGIFNSEPVEFKKKPEEGAPEIVIKKKKIPEAFLKEAIAIGNRSSIKVFQAT